MSITLTHEDGTTEEIEAVTMGGPHTITAGRIGMARPVAKAINRVDPERVDAFEEALIRLGEEYGFGITQFHLAETRHPSGDLPELEVTFIQLPRNDKEEKAKAPRFIGEA